MNKIFAFLFVVVSLALNSCSATSGNNDETADDKVNTLIITDFYESSDYNGYCYYEVSKYNTYRKVVDDVTSLLKPCGYYSIGDTLQ